MYRGMGIVGLGAMSLTATKWKITAEAPEGSSFFTAGDDVAARVATIEAFVKANGGTVTDISWGVMGASRTVYFTLPRAAYWSYAWGNPTRDMSFVESQADAAARAATAVADEAAQARIAQASQSAQSATDYASAQAQMNIRDADARAAERIKQARDSAILVAVLAISLAGVTYVLVTD